MVIKLFTTDKTYQNSNAYDNTHFDVTGRNVYDINAPSFGDHYKNVAAQNADDSGDNAYYALNNTTSQYRIKPVMHPETGPLHSDCDPHQVEIIRELYLRPFTGLAMGLDWNLWEHPNLFQYFNPLKTFLSNYDLHSSDSETGLWHPGASELVDGYKWNFNTDFSDAMYAPWVEATNTQNHRNVDIAYLRRADNKQAIGVITNKTVNNYTQSDCKHDQFSLGDSHSDLSNNSTDTIPINCSTPILVNPLFQGVSLKGLKNGIWTVTFYKYSAPNIPVVIMDYIVTSHTLQLNYFIGTSLDEYIVLFDAQHRSITSHKMVSDSTNLQEEIKEPIVTESSPYLYPNPSNDFVTISNLSSGEIEIQDARGASISKQTFKGNQFRIDISKYEPGIYYVNIEYINGKKCVLKFIKV